MATTFMVCGCVARATDANGDPVCVTHLGIQDGANRPAEVPDLTGRKAQCSDCRTTKDSSPSLAFFTHRSNSELDSFYCGCRGWN